jgi:hypothetical protein
MKNMLKLFVLCVILLPSLGNAQINTDYSSTEFEMLDSMRKSNDFIEDFLRCLVM